MSEHLVAVQALRSVYPEATIYVRTSKARVVASYHVLTDNRQHNLTLEEIFQNGQQIGKRTWDDNLNVVHFTTVEIRFRSYDDEHYFFIPSEYYKNLVMRYQW